MLEEIVEMIFGRIGVLVIAACVVISVLADAIVQIIKAAR